MIYQSSSFNSYRKLRYPSDYPQIHSVVGDTFDVDLISDSDDTDPLFYFDELLDNYSLESMVRQANQLNTKSYRPKINYD